MIPRRPVDALRAVNAAIDDRNYEIGISFFLKDGAALRLDIAGHLGGGDRTVLRGVFLRSARQVGAATLAEAFQERSRFLESNRVDAMRRIIDLQEEETGRFPRTTLLDADILALKSRGDSKSSLHQFSTITSSGFARGDGSAIFRSLTIYWSASSRKFLSAIFLQCSKSPTTFAPFGCSTVKSKSTVSKRSTSASCPFSRVGCSIVLVRACIAATSSEAEELPYVRGRIDVVGAVLNAKRGIPSIPCGTRSTLPTLRTTGFCSGHYIRFAGRHFEERRYASNLIARVGRSPALSLSAMLAKGLRQPTLSPSQR